MEKRRHDSPHGPGNSSDDERNPKKLKGDPEDRGGQSKKGFDRKDYERRYGSRKGYTSDRIYESHISRKREESIERVDRDIYAGRTRGDGRGEEGYESNISQRKRKREEGSERGESSTYVSGAKNDNRGEEVYESHISRKRRKDIERIDSGTKNDKTEESKTEEQRKRKRSERDLDDGKEDREKRRKTEYREWLDRSREKIRMYHRELYDEINSYAISNEDEKKMYRDAISMLDELEKTVSSVLKYYKAKCSLREDSRVHKMFIKYLLNIYHEESRAIKVGKYHNISDLEENIKKSIDEIGRALIPIADFTLIIIREDGNHHGDVYKKLHPLVKWIKESESREQKSQRLQRYQEYLQGYEKEFKLLQGKLQALRKSYGRGEDVHMTSLFKEFGSCRANMKAISSLIERDCLPLNPYEQLELEDLTHDYHKAARDSHNRGERNQVTRLEAFSRMIEKAKALHRYYADLAEWTIRDQSQESSESSQREDDYDLVIIGAGVAGTTYFNTLNRMDLQRMTGKGRPRIAVIGQDGLWPRADRELSMGQPPHLLSFPWLGGNIPPSDKFMLAGDYANNIKKSQTRMPIFPFMADSIERSEENKKYLIKMRGDARSFSATKLVIASGPGPGYKPEITVSTISPEIDTQHEKVITGVDYILRDSFPKYKKSAKIAIEGATATAAWAYLKALQAGYRAENIAWFTNGSDFDAAFPPGGRNDFVRELSKNSRETNKDLAEARIKGDKVRLSFKDDSSKVVDQYIAAIGVDPKRPSGVSDVISKEILGALKPIYDTNGYFYDNKKRAVLALTSEDGSLIAIGSNLLRAMEQQIRLTEAFREVADTLPAGSSPLGGSPLLIALITALNNYMDPRYVNLNTMHRTTLAAYIAREYPWITSLKANEYVERIVKSRKAQKRKAYGMNSDDIRSIEREMKQANRKGRRKKFLEAIKNLEAIRDIADRKKRSNIKREKDIGENITVIGENYNIKDIGPELEKLEKQLNDLKNDLAVLADLESNTSQTDSENKVQNSIINLGEALKDLDAKYHKEDITIGPMKDRYEYLIENFIARYKQFEWHRSLAKKEGWSTENKEAFSKLPRKLQNVFFELSPERIEHVLASPEEQREQILRKEILEMILSKLPKRARDFRKLIETAYKSLAKSLSETQPIKFEGDDAAESLARITDKITDIVIVTNVNFTTIETGDIISRGKMSEAFIGLLRRAEKHEIPLILMSDSRRPSIEKAFIEAGVSEDYVRKYVHTITENGIWLGGPLANGEEKLIDKRAEEYIEPAKKVLDAIEKDIRNDSKLKEYTQQPGDPPLIGIIRKTLGGVIQGIAQIDALKSYLEKKGLSEKEIEKGIKIINAKIYKIALTTLGGIELENGQHASKIFCLKNNEMAGIDLSLSPATGIKIGERSALQFILEKLKSKKALLAFSSDTEAAKTSHLAEEIIAMKKTNHFADYESESAQKARINKLIKFMSTAKERIVPLEPDMDPLTDELKETIAIAKGIAEETAEIAKYAILEEEVRPELGIMAQITLKMDAMVAEGSIDIRKETIEDIQDIMAEEMTEIVKDTITGKSKRTIIETIETLISDAVGFTVRTQKIMQEGGIKRNAETISKTIETMVLKAIEENSDIRDIDEVKAAEEVAEEVAKIVEMAILGEKIETGEELMKKITSAAEIATLKQKTVEEENDKVLAEWSDSMIEEIQNIMTEEMTETVKDTMADTMAETVAGVETKTILETIEMIMINAVEIMKTIQEIIQIRGIKRNAETISKTIEAMIHEAIEENSGIRDIDEVKAAEEVAEEVAKIVEMAILGEKIETGEELMKKITSAAEIATLKQKTVEEENDKVLAEWSDSMIEEIQNIMTEEMTETVKDTMADTMAETVAGVETKTILETIEMIMINAEEDAKTVQRIMQTEGIERTKWDMIAEKISKDILGKVKKMMFVAMIEMNESVEKMDEEEKEEEIKREIAEKIAEIAENAILEGEMKKGEGLMEEIASVVESIMIKQSKGEVTDKTIDETIAEMEEIMVGTMTETVKKTMAETMAETMAGTETETIIETMETIISNAVKMVQEIETTEKAIRDAKTISKTISKTIKAMMLRAMEEKDIQAMDEEEKEEEIKREITEKIVKIVRDAILGLKVKTKEEIKGEIQEEILKMKEKGIMEIEMIEMIENTVEEAITGTITRAVKRTMEGTIVEEMVGETEGTLIETIETIIKNAAKNIETETVTITETLRNARTVSEAIKAMIFTAIEEKMEKEKRIAEKTAKIVKKAILEGRALEELETIIEIKAAIGEINIKGMLEEETIETMQEIMEKTMEGTITEKLKKTIEGTIEGTLLEDMAGTMEGTLTETIETIISNAKNMGTEKEEIQKNAKIISEIIEMIMIDAIGEEKIKTIKKAIAEKTAKIVKKAILEGRTEELEIIQEIKAAIEIEKLKRNPMIEEETIETMQEIMEKTMEGTITEKLKKTMEGTIEGTLLEDMAGTMEGTLTETIETIIKNAKNMGTEKEEIQKNAKIISRIIEMMIIDAIEEIEEENDEYESDKEEFNEEEIKKAKHAIPLDRAGIEAAAVLRNELHEELVSALGKKRKESKLEGGYFIGFRRSDGSIDPDVEKTANHIAEGPVDAMELMTKIIDEIIVRWYALEGGDSV